MTRTPITRFAGASMLALVLASPVALSPVLASPAHAFFGFGRIVYDPSNYAQNVMTAARTLEQINNQIQQLQNKAQMLINQARNLAGLPPRTAPALFKKKDRHAAPVHTVPLQRM